MTNREKLREVFGSKINFEFALDPEWLGRDYKEPLNYKPKNNDVVEFYDGTLGFVDGTMVINKNPFTSNGWIVLDIVNQIAQGYVKNIYRGSNNPLYYIMGNNRSDLEFLDLVYPIQTHR